jgi:hypothetical protein
MKQEINHERARKEHASGNEKQGVRILPGSESRAGASLTWPQLITGFCGTTQHVSAYTVLVFSHLRRIAYAPSRTSQVLAVEMPSPRSQLRAA